MNIIVLFIFLPSLLSSVSCTPRGQSSSPETLNEAAVKATLFMSLVIFVFALLITAFCFVFIRCISNRNRALPQVTRGLDPRVLSTCPVMSYSALKLNHPKAVQNAPFQCAVCLADFADDDTLRLLPKCGHVFHTRCIEEWLAAHVTCPVCRSDVSAETGDACVRNVLEEEDSVRDFGVLVRSHSTGHSLEGFSIKVPEEAKKKVLEDEECGNSTKMNRSSSYDVVLGIEEGGVGSTTTTATTTRTNDNNNSWILWTSQPIDSGDSEIPKFWGASMVREDKEKGKVKEFDGRTFFDCEV
ncbi:hypothetical protein LR48_Vigan10g088600 [Vigna angularis]|uniref:RING-type E3 ubiquitin transferase n=2 Tax=Phaseolus angularis TaxID=3914 RepID=A0A0L9VJX1_PHAAN|nr:E3 ubiquitin-protein ligase ATL31 [Vigna angularis]KAG2384820.1 E3 ubiquitin-protein [Vigna angularis]KOM54994.1 hypothetical protein LR48_Vigan10g088600 [Vigna angularis]BAU02365.1 hypothetical protein VIGAN_11187800 [Vigna angularis var. angularis]